MLKKIAPQKVADDDLGYVIQVADRYHVEYLESGKCATIEVDFGPFVGIYRDTLKYWMTPTGQCFMSDDERNSVLSRVDEALRFMGSKTEFC